MAFFKAFCAVRPQKECAEKVACLPYDVMNRSEAKALAAGNPYSFLRVVRSELELPDHISSYDERVYKKALENLKTMIATGTMKKDFKPNYYIYRQIMDERVQTGVVGCASIDDYLNNVIKKHEFTRVEKEEDRIRHFHHCNANTEPVFLTYKFNEKINAIIQDWIDSHEPEYHFISEDSITHILWVVDDRGVVSDLSSAFDTAGSFYIADGHHRSASAVKVGVQKRQDSHNYKGDEEFNAFMAVAFPDNDLYIMGYNRVVKDLNGLSTEEFLEKVSEKFDVLPHGTRHDGMQLQKHCFGMFLDSKWYMLNPKNVIYSEMDVIERLDASILQNNLLAPILGINDPRTDKRIDFVGGIRGYSELENRVNNGMAVAFEVFPVDIRDVMEVADSGNVMPPKSTWFEPKLRSGLFVHELD